MSNNASNDFANRQVNLMMKLCFLKTATACIVKDISENGGGREIDEAAFGLQIVFDEVIAEVDTLKLSYAAGNEKSNGKEGR